MGIEIERKFLIDKDKWNKINKGVGKRYRQGYILTDPTKTVRVRLSDTDGYITIKGLSVGATRLEYEYAIPTQDAKELLDNFCASVVSKYRYKVAVGNKLWEVDEFQEDNEGLILAEIELSSEQEQFDLPDWVTIDVTDQQQYYNSNLSVNPYKNWKE